MQKSSAKIAKKCLKQYFFSINLRLSHDLKQHACNFATEILEKGYLRVKLFCNYRVMRCGTEHNRELGRDVISEQRGLMQDE